VAIASRVRKNTDVRALRHPALLTLVLDALNMAVGDAYDTALCESFFATVEYELLDRRRFPTQAEA
jgi:hypothetical protein